MTNPLHDLIAAHKRLREMREQIPAEALCAYFAPIFDADPRVKAIVWGQWAPYFNDGEPCVFALHYESLLRGEISSSPPPYWNAGDPLYVDSYGEEISSDLRPLERQACTLLADLPRAYLESIAQDGVIQVTRETVETFDYSHN